MGADGYSSEMIGSYLHVADHLGQWAAPRRGAIADLDEHETAVRSEGKAR